MSSSNRSHMQQIHCDYMCLSVHGEPSHEAGSEEKEMQDEEMKKGRGDKRRVFSKGANLLIYFTKRKKKRRVVGNSVRELA